MSNDFNEYVHIKTNVCVFSHFSISQLLRITEIDWIRAVFRKLSECSTLKNLFECKMSVNVEYQLPIAILQQMQWQNKNNKKKKIRWTVVICILFYYAHTTRQKLCILQLTMFTAMQIYTISALNQFEGEKKTDAYYISFELFMKAPLLTAIMNV